MRLKNPATLEPIDAACLLSRIQAILWRDENGKVDTESDWSADTLDAIATAMVAFDLAPIENARKPRGKKVK